MFTMVGRRRFLMAAGSATGLGLIAGCTGGGGTEATTTEPPTETETTTATPTPTPESKVVDVAVGPEKRLRFEPESIEIRVGDTVRWTAESVGHNVTSKPGASEKCKNPEGAEPFASYEGDQHFAIMDVGATYEHTFEVPGTYVYVCAPHAGQGMVGDITVGE